MPSTSAYAPKIATSAMMAVGGQNSAITPKMIAAAPRKASAHQWRARFIAMIFSSVGAAAAMATAPGVLVNGSGLTRLLLLLPAGGRARAALDLDPAASARFLRQGDRDFENAVLEPRLRVLRVHAIRQRD